MASVEARPAQSSSFACASILHLVGGENEHRCGSGEFAVHSGSMAAPFGVVGLNHRTATPELRARAAIPSDALGAFLIDARERGMAECIVLSTCNRTEVYYAGGSEALTMQLLAERSGVEIADLRRACYSRSCVCTACHLFRVVSSLDSAVLGETEIVAQVKDAWRTAQEFGTSGNCLDLLFQRALEAGKRVRSETEVCRNVTSTCTMAVREASRRLGELDQKRVLILGAGRIAERILASLVESGATNIRIANRTTSRAIELGRRYGASGTGLDNLAQEVSLATVVFAAAACDQPLVTEIGETGPEIIFDFGVPANVSLSPGATVVIGLDELAANCESNTERRLRAVPAALSILEDEVSRLAIAMAERSAAPTIKALVQKGESIRQHNLDWARERLGFLDERQMRVVEEMSRRMMIGLLERPIERLKSELSAQEHRELVERLFALDRGGNA